MLKRSGDGGPSGLHPWLHRSTIQQDSAGHFSPGAWSNGYVGFTSPGLNRRSNIDVLFFCKWPSSNSKSRGSSSQIRRWFCFLLFMSGASTKPLNASLKPILADFGASMGASTRLHATLEDQSVRRPHHGPHLIEVSRWRGHFGASQPWSQLWSQPASSHFGLVGA
jgi:hypothetical protein